MLLPPSGALAPSTKYLGVAQLLLLPSRVSTSKKILVVEDNEDCRELQAVRHQAPRISGD